MNSFFGIEKLTGGKINRPHTVSGLLTAVGPLSVKQRKAGEAIATPAFGIGALEIF